MSAAQHFASLRLENFLCELTHAKVKSNLFLKAKL